MNGNGKTALPLNSVIDTSGNLRSRHFSPEFGRHENFSREAGNSLEIVKSESNISVLKRVEATNSLTEVGSITCGKQQNQMSVLSEFLQLFSFQTIQGHWRGETIELEMMGHFPIQLNRNQFVFHRGCSFNLKSVFGAGVGAGLREGRDEAPKPITKQGVNTLKTLFTGFYGGHKRKEEHFWHTKLHAIITCSTVPLNCIERVISQLLHEIAMKGAWHDARGHITKRKDETIHTTTRHHDAAQLSTARVGALRPMPNCQGIGSTRVGPSRTSTVHRGDYNQEAVGCSTSRARARDTWKRTRTHEQQQQKQGDLRSCWKL